MNSKSTHDYRWSIRIIGQESIYIGIASKLKRTQDWILYYDENSLTYAPLGGYVWKANTVIEHKFIKADSGDEVHFRFQPKLKKFSISFVSSILHDCFWYWILGRRGTFFRYQGRCGLFPGYTRSKWFFCNFIQSSRTVIDICFSLNKVKILWFFICYCILKMPYSKTRLIWTIEPSQMVDHVTALRSVQNIRRK